MKKRVIIIVSVIILALLSVCAMIFFINKPMMKTIGIELPNGQGTISGTIFKGSQPSPLDGTLRICWIKDGSLKFAQLTNIPVDKSIKLMRNETLLEVWKSKQKLMEFQLETNKLICISGS